MGKKERVDLVSYITERGSIYHKQTRSVRPYSRHASTLEELDGSFVGQRLRP